MSREARQQEMEEARQDMVEAALAADRKAALRDVFAAAALSAVIVSEGNYIGADPKRRQADDAYEYADAMLKAREA